MNGDIRHSRKEGFTNPWVSLRGAPATKQSPLDGEIASLNSARHDRELNSPAAGWCVCRRPCKNWRIVRAHWNNISIRPCRKNSTPSAARTTCRAARFQACSPHARRSLRRPSAKLTRRLRCNIMRRCNGWNVREPILLYAVCDFSKYMLVRSQ